MFSRPCIYWLICSNSDLLLPLIIASRYWGGCDFTRWSKPCRLCANLYEFGDVFCWNGPDVLSPTFGSHCDNGSLSKANEADEICQ